MRSDAVHPALPRRAPGVTWPWLRAQWRRQARNPLARRSAFVMGSQFSIALLQALQFFLLARALGPAEFGHVASVVAIVSVLVPFSGLGLGNMAVLRIARGQASAATSLGNALAMTTGTAVIGVALAVAIGAGFLREPGTWLLMLLVGVSDILLTKYIDVAAHVFYGLDRHRFPVLFYNLHMAARVLCAAALWAGLTPPTALAWAGLHLASGVVAATAVLATAIAMLGRPRTALASAIADARSGFFFSVSIASRSVQFDIDKSVLARSASTATAGVYTAAFRIVFMACMPVFALMVAVQARMFRKGHEAGLPGTLRAVRPLVMAAAAYCVVLGVALYAGAPAVPWLLGESYHGSVEIMRWMCLLPVFFTTHTIAAAALAGADAQQPLGLVHALTAGVALVLNLQLVPGFGWAGAVMAAYGSHAFLLAGMLVLIVVRLRKPVPQAVAP
ncbi:lipopolysaccharide biosynthesis protein [Ramlibacter sp. PS4R-6]|uniref:lipopolysaccharide biosynthesis protein n=1 Tax=Ramlibacter sp. PS4R-6 TaxID=3133438 RepID=UPI0030AAF684